MPSTRRSPPRARRGPRGGRGPRSGLADRGVGPPRPAATAAPGLRIGRPTGRGRRQAPRRGTVPRQPRDPEPEAESKDKPPTDEALKRASAEALKRAGPSDPRTGGEHAREDRSSHPSPRPKSQPRESSGPRSPLPLGLNSTRNSGSQAVDVPEPIEIAEADAAFLAKRYDEAGRIYTALDRERRLPAQRRDHWAYCRWVDLVRRINANPTTAKEWASINAESGRLRAEPEQLVRRIPAQPRRRTFARRPPTGVRSGHPAGLGPGRAPVDRPGAIKASPPRTVPGTPARPPARLGRRARTTTHPHDRRLAGARVDELPDYHRDRARRRVASAAESARVEQSKRWAGAGLEERGRPGVISTSTPRPRLQPDDRPARGLAGLLDDGAQRGPDRRPPYQPPRGPSQHSGGHPPARDHARDPGRLFPTQRTRDGPMKGWPSSPSPGRNSEPEPPT